MGYKVCVYAICKNEEKFCARWMASMREADWVVVLDTGSSDGTVEKLRALGAIVAQEMISPWRFDAARNRSMELIPEEADICVCVDLDEEFAPGWRKALEDGWREEATQGRYRYNWSFREDGSEGVVFYSDKAHRRGMYVWAGAVHEVLKAKEGVAQKIVTLPGVQLNHHPDPAKSRAQYLPLLETAVREEPQNDRYAHYLGREYMYHGLWARSIEQLKRHLSLRSAVWPAERCASMRYIARDYAHLGRWDEAEAWLLRAAAEAPDLREPWVELAQLLYRAQDWHGTCFAAGRALAIGRRPLHYISEDMAWGALPYDLRSVARSRLGAHALALEDAREAEKRAPGDARIRENVRVLEELAGQMK